MSLIETVDARARGLRPRRLEHGAEAGAFLRRVDWLLLGATLGLVAYGLWALDGITAHDPGGSSAPRQAAYAIVGLLILSGVMLVDPVVYRRFGRPIYAGALGLMAFVLLAGAATRGSHRWVDIGPIRFQPSEFGKLLLVLALAAFVADRAKRIGEWRTVAATVAFGIPPILLVFAQPDIGTALVYSAALGGVLFVAGTRWRHLAVVAAAALFLAFSVLWLLPAAGVQVLKPYQAKRITGFTHPDSDPRGATYNVTQSITAVGAGQERGRGVAGATQTTLNYLPEHATDFAFASLAEQRGFLGVAVLLLLYLLVVWRGLKVIAVARDLFSAVVAGGIVVAFLFQIFVNVGMTIGIAPVTGIPLPFVSVGGSSLLTNLLAVGVLLAIGVRGQHRRLRWPG
jgi:rod shape determining protein RodA